MHTFRNSLFCHINFTHLKMHASKTFFYQTAFWEYFYQHFQMHFKMTVWIVPFKIKVAISIPNVCIFILFQNAFQNKDKPNAFWPILKWKWRSKWPNDQSQMTLTHQTLIWGDLLVKYICKRNFTQFMCDVFFIIFFLKGLTCVVQSMTWHKCALTW